MSDIEGQLLRSRCSLALPWYRTGLEVRELAALLEDPRLVPTDHAPSLRATFNNYSGSSDTLLGHPSLTDKRTNRHPRVSTLVIGAPLWWVSLRNSVSQSQFTHSQYVRSKMGA